MTVEHGAPQSISFNGPKMLVGNHNGTFSEYSFSSISSETNARNGQAYEFKFLQDLLLPGSSDGKIVKVDWAKNGKYVRACTTLNGAYVLNYYKVDPANGSLEYVGMNGIKEASSSDWATWESPIGWEVQGAWKGHEGKESLTSACRSNDHEMFAAADAGGSMRLYGFPCVSEKAPCAEAGAHPSGASNVAFNANDELLFSTGQDDCCIMQWRVEGL